MKQIKKRWLGLVITTALFALFGIASPAMAQDYNGPCAGAPDTINGTGTITDGACAGRTITATGALSVTSGGAVSATSLSGATLTVQGSSVTVPSLSSAFGPVIVNATGGAATLGTINAVNGSFSVTASTSVTASGALVSSYGPSVITASNGAVLVKDVTVTSGQVTITSTGGAITTDNVTASYELDIKSNGAFAINTKILTANNGNIKVDSGKTLTIVGLTKSTLYDIELKAVNDLKTDIIEAGRNLTVTSSSGNVNTKDLTADQGALKVKADVKITIVGITKTNKYDIDLDAKNIVKTNAITSGSHVRVNSTDENINITSTIDSNIDDSSGGNILLTANKSIISRSINTHGNTKVGAVRIVANKGGASTLFIIGTTATTNGVKGTITTNTVTGGGTNPTTFNFGIYIQNGTVASTGGITLVSAANLKVAASNSKAGTIILDARNGTLTLPTGTLNANAASGKQAGSIVLLAKTVTTASGTILSATQTTAAPPSGHSVSIAAETINLAGTAGLKIQTNGNGVTGFPALATLSPQGSIVVYSDDNSVLSMYWQVDNFNTTFTAKPLTVAGVAPLTVTSNGDESQIVASGWPLKFTNTDITLQSRGKLNNRVDVVYNGPDNGSTNIIFENTGTVALDANGSGGPGGKVNIYGDKVSLKAPLFNVTATGPATGNGNGGELYFRSTAATLSPTSKASFKADAAIVGTGNASANAIIFYPGATDVEIGNDVGQFSFSANGGKTQGDAGNITINPAGNINVHNTLATTLPVTASAIGTTGDGGKISLVGYPNVTFAGSSIAIKADGGSVSGSGGEIKILGNGTIDIGSTTDAVTLSAKAPGTSNPNTKHGGTVEIGYTTILTVDAAGVDVSTAGNALGGEINFHDIGNLTLSGTLKANAIGTGNSVGGSITLTASQINLPASSNTLLSATSAGTGSGGKVKIESRFAPANIGTANNQLSINTSNTGSGSGGDVDISAGGTLTVQASAINVSAGPTAPSTVNAGGAILLATTSGSIHASGIFQASAGPLGIGGVISFQSAQDINLADQSRLFAIGNGNSGFGGTITLATGVNTNATGTVNYASSNIILDASGTADKGGSIQILTADPTTTSVLQILGPIYNNGTKTGGGLVTINNKYATGVRANTGIISAVKGQITFLSSNGPIEVTGIAPSGTPGPYFGPVSMSGTDLTLQANGSADLLLGDFDASGDIRIQTDIGNMTSDGTTELESTSPGGTITLISTSGKIGTGSFTPLNVSASFVDFNSGITPVSGSQIYVNVFGPVTLKEVMAHGDIFITGSDNIVLSDNVKTIQGNIGIKSTGGAIVLNSGVEALAQEGTLFFQGQTAITLQANSKVRAVTTTTNTALGNVDISLLAPGSGFTTTTPANINITSGGQYIKFGVAGITANAPVNTLSSTGQRFLLLDTNGLPPQFFVLGGGVIISADGN